MNAHAFGRGHLARLLLALTMMAAVLPASAQPDLAQLLDRNPAALVTVQFVLQVKISGSLGSIMGEKQEFESEAVCVMIDPKGLVLCSNTQIGAYSIVLQRVMGSMGADTEVSSTPTQIRVLVVGEPQFLNASLLVRDTELDLAWLQIESGGSRPFSYIDFSKGASVGIGTSVFALRRLDSFFDRAPSLLEGRIGGVTSKPRPLYIPTGSIETHFGLPVITRTGEVVGILILQLPEEGAPRSQGMSMESMSWASRMQNLSRGVILPAFEVVKATRRATDTLTKSLAKPSFR